MAIKAGMETRPCNVSWLKKLLRDYRERELERDLHGLLYRKSSRAEQLGLGTVTVEDVRRVRKRHEQPTTTKGTPEEGPRVVGGAEAVEEVGGRTEKDRGAGPARA